MPYAGNSPAANFASVTKDLFSGDGSTVAFTLSKASTTNGVAVFVENVRQEPTIAYAVSGTTLTFTAAPVTSSGNNIYVLHHNAPASTANHPASQDLTAVAGTFSGDVSVGDDLTVTDDILLSSDSAAIKFGADSEITLTHSADSGLLLKHAASGDDKFPTLTLQTGDTDIAVNDVLGQINFQAPDEGAGTDAILDGASIRAISEGDFSASNNATTLQFMTGATAAPTKRMTISSTGETTITRAGSVTDHGGLLRLNGTYGSTNKGPNIMFHGTATSQYPSMQILNYSHDDQSINFDAFYDGSNWKSSDAGSQFQIVKRSDNFNIRAENGIAAGSNVTWVNHFNIATDGTLTATDTSIGSISDQRLKKNIQDYTYPLDNFKSLATKIFDWENPKLHGSTTQQIGFLAQDVESLDSRWVRDFKIDEDSPDASLLDSDLISKASRLGEKDAMYVSVIQQLITKIETLEAKVKTLEEA